MLSRLIVDYFEIINIKLNVSGGTTLAGVLAGSYIKKIG